MAQWPAWPHTSAAAPGHRLPSRTVWHSLFPLLVLLLALPLACQAFPGVTDSSLEPQTLCPNSCLCAAYAENVTGAQRATCQLGGLTRVPSDLPASLLTLDLSHNAIEHLDNVTRLSQLRVLDLSNNSITALQVPSLDNLFHLTQLDLSHNKIAAVKARVFGALASIQTLNLAHNKLQTVTEDELFGLQTVKVLNLSNNLISNVGNSTFLYFAQLQILDLSHNQLDNLHPSAFHGLHALHHLFLHHNRLMVINSVFHSLHQLQTLDLSLNNLQELKNNTFVDLPSLKKLHLSFNNISYFPPAFASNLYSTQTLDLAGNAFENLPGKSFQGLVNLKTLDLSQMPYLWSVSHDAFTGLSSLSLLNLSHNPNLSFLHPQLLTPLEALSLLDLRGCQLPTLSPVTFHANPQLHTLYLAHNPWQCGCGLLWTLGTNASSAVTTITGTVADINITMCQQQGDKTHAVPLTRLAELQINCSRVQVDNVTSGRAVRVADSLRLTCHATMDDSGILSWLTPHGLVFHYHPFHPEAISHLVSTENASNLTSPFHRHHDWHSSTSYASNLYQHPDHIVLLSDGSLFIDYVLRSDAGPYTCIAHNAQHQAKGVTVVTLDHDILFQVKFMSIMAGLGCAATFFTLNAVYVVIMWAARKLINKRRRERIHKIMTSVDDYRAMQITRIRANYNYQIGRIRDHYQGQSQRLRDNYNMQMKRVRRGCSNQVEKIRDNYHQRLTHLKDYSSHQIQQIRDCTNNQIVRIRGYGSLQMEKLRETYKLQSKHVLKMMEAMNLDNCKNVIEAECMRTDSMVFDINFPEFPDEEEDGSGSVEAEEDYSQTDSEYATALNTDGSSQESLATALNAGAITTVEDITIEVQPVDLPPTPNIIRNSLIRNFVVLGELEVLPPDTSSQTMCSEKEDSSNTTSSDAVKETIV